MTHPRLHRWSGHLAKHGLLFAGLLALVVLAAFTVTRIGLVLQTGIDHVPAGEWPLIFAKGLWFDIAVLCFLLVPVLLHEALLGSRLRKARWPYGLRLAVFWMLTAVLLFGAASEALFWIEFDTRFNFIAVDYLIYTREVIGNIRESYPVAELLLAIVVAATALTWALRTHIGGSVNTMLVKRARWRLLAAALVLPSASLLLANADQMRGSGNAYAEELSGNGLYTFAAAMRRNELDYARWYATIPQERADRILRELGVERQPLTEALRQDPSEERREPLPAFLLRKPRNVVLITVESLSADYLGVYGSSKGLTPRLDEIARRGVLFDRVLATGTRTVRGLEALSLGTPPVPGQAIVRRPGNEHLATIGEILEHQGFATHFVYGGYGYFDNMNAYFAGNDYNTHDRTDFPKESVVFENVWGVADESLFANTVRLIDDMSTNGKRFMVHVMTTSNHRPYTYPDGRIDIPSPGGREGAVKYTDFAIGQFLEAARNTRWFDDTLFVIVADHCSAVAGRAELPVARYHIPLILYGPRIVKPERVARLISQIDIPPMLLDMLGAEGDDHFFGKGVHEQSKLPERAFISNYQSLGYYKRGILTVLKPKRRVESFAIDPKTLDATPAPVDEALRDEAIAYYQTASQAFKTGKLKGPDY
ncbi:MAG: sulfatase-like hydrolase/transferase [Gammaproteobacteria bacterium]|nr:sulfatase-like hydrolase/transferase [Gammaproteobacteria bacterium]